MKITAALTFVVALAHGASAYVINAYTEPDCQGEYKRVNVWKDTCRDDNIPKNTRSVKLEQYGAWRQRASFYKTDWCKFGFEDQAWWVDGGSTQVGDCKNMDFGVNAFASWFDLKGPSN